MKVLVINAGSSSLKFQLIDMNGEVVIAKGTCGRVGAEMGEFDIKTEKGKFEKEGIELNVFEIFKKLGCGDKKAFGILAL